MGHWLDPAKDFVNQFRDTLTGRPVWLFFSGPVGKPTGKFARSMDQDPVDTRCWCSAGWRETSAPGPASGSGPKVSPGSLRWRPGERRRLMAHGTQGLASRPGHGGKVSAARIIAAAFGIGQACSASNMASSKPGRAAPPLPGW
jgi:hypothetical protein